MSLTVKLKNIGILKQAEFSLGDLTIICGENNTGKTTAAYALFGFLKSWRDFIHFPMNDVRLQGLFTDGTLRIELTQYVEKVDQMLAEACRKYTQQLDKIFAAPKGTFHNSEFDLQTEAIDLRDKAFEGGTIVANKPVFNCSKPKGSEELTVVLAAIAETDFSFAEISIHSMICGTFFSDIFPDPFISSSERTGVAIFREFLSKMSPSYPAPIQDNVRLTREIEYLGKRQSFIAKEHPEILADFADIIGGEYALIQNNRPYHIPKGSKLMLTMGQSSSAVRSLLDIGFYLRHLAEKGHLLMVDEPELSLHPENQRRIARLFARLANLGVKVFITTHSDYIVKELNTLIMLNHDKPHLKRVAEENGYQESELINADQVKVYVAEEKLMPLEEGQKRRRRGHTLVPADIDHEFGIEVGSFDKTIDDMNRIQKDIVWGAK